MQLWDSMCWPHVNPVPSGAVRKDCQRRLLSRPRFVRACSATDLFIYKMLWHGRHFNKHSVASETLRHCSSNSDLRAAESLPECWPLSIAAGVQFVPSLRQLVVLSLVVAVGRTHESLCWLKLSCDGSYGEIISPLSLSVPRCPPAIHLTEMLHSCADTAHPARASTRCDLGSVTLWDWHRPASLNCYFSENNWQHLHACGFLWKYWKTVTVIILFSFLAQDIV
jgi:hypothetical protein